MVLLARTCVLSACETLGGRVLKQKNCRFYFVILKGLGAQQNKGTCQLEKLHILHTRHKPQQR